MAKVVDLAVGESEQKNLDFEPSEYRERLARLHGAMQARGAEVMLLDEPEILAYVIGYERSVSFYRACIVSLDADPVMVLRQLDRAPFLEKSWLRDCEGFADTEDAVARVAAELQRRGYADKAIGIDFGSHALSVAYFARLKEALPNARFVPMTGVPWELRLIKSPAEVAYISRAASIADQTMSDVIEMVQPGMSERQVAAFVARRFVEQGADTGHIGPITAARGWGFLHGHLHDTALAAGDVLHLELVPRVHGYSARLMRCVAIGGISSEQQTHAEQIVAIQDRQIAAMQPGARAVDVDRILREGLVAAGLRASYDNITGYTLGYYSQQPLRSSDFTRTFNPNAGWTIEGGMVFHMYTSACGLAFSETVHVTPKGPQRLTRIERRLFSC